MTTTVIGVQGLESLQPAVDYRRSGRVGVLSGRNFAWDAAGVHSAYASRLVAGSTSIGQAPAIAQTLDLKEAIHIALDGHIHRLVPASAGSPVGSWEVVDDLLEQEYPNPQDTPYNFRKWWAAYLGNKPYACSYNYGTFEVDLGVNPATYTKLDSGNTTGFPTAPVIAIAETNGRMLYLTESTFYWSGPNAPRDLIPALGGAGFQVIAERIGGTPFAVTETSQGAIIWTTSGALVAEFIGGDNVFRFWQLSTKALPVSSFAITRMPDDDYIMLTRLGLFMFNNMSQPQPITPLFNEFLREYLRLKSDEIGHVWYSITDNRLYVGMRPGGSSFSATYALDIVLDRWGIFSDQHIGFFDYGVSRGQLAYATPSGVASFLLSSADARKNRESPAAPGTYVGLGSEIIIGWLRAENLIPHADVVQELSEIVINRLEPLESEIAVIVDEGLVTSPLMTFVDEGLVTDVSVTVFDEGLVSSSVAVIDYSLEVYSDLFSETQDSEDAEHIYVPELARQNRRSDLWVTLVPALYYRLRFSATEPDEFYRVNSMDLTVSYAGNLS